MSTGTEWELPRRIPINALKMWYWKVSYVSKWVSVRIINETFYAFASDQSPVCEDQIVKITCGNSTKFTSWVPLGTKVNWLDFEVNIKGLGQISTLESISYKWILGILPDRQRWRESNLRTKCQRSVSWSSVMMTRPTSSSATAEKPRCRVGRFG